MAPPFPLSASVWTGGRTVSRPAFVPGSSQISFVSKIAGRTDLAVVDASGGPETALPLDPPLRGDYDWLPDGSGVVYVAADGYLHHFDCRSSACSALTTFSDGISGLTISPDGQRIAYCSEMAAVVVVGTDGSGWPQRVSGNADFVADPSWTPDGMHLPWVEWDVPNMGWDDSRIVVRRADMTSPARTVAGGNGASVQQPRFSPDGTRLAFLSDASGWLNLWMLDAKTLDSHAHAIDEQHEHGGPLWGSGQHSYAWATDNAIVFERNDKGRLHLIRCDVSTGKVTTVSKTSAHGLICNGSHAVCIAAGPRQVDALTSYELFTGNATTLATSGYAGVAQRCVEPIDVTWQATDGATVHGRLYRSNDNDALLVWIHSGPTGQSHATAHHRIGYFVERGWSVLAVDYRGTTGWGRTYQQALNGNWGVTDVDDVHTGVQWAASNGIADVSKVVLYGGSSAGVTGLVAMARHPKAFAGGVFSYPVSDLFDLDWKTHRLEAHYNRKLIGELPESYDDYVDRSPIHLAHLIEKPVLLMHGTADVVVPVDNTRELEARLRRSGVDVEAHYYEGEGHGWRNASTRADELDRIDMFLRQRISHEGPMKVEER